MPKYVDDLGNRCWKVEGVKLYCDRGKNTVKSNTPETFKTDLRDLPYHRKGELLQSCTGNFLQPMQTVTFWQAMWKKTTTTTNNKQLLARNVTKWPSYYNWPNLSPALRWGLYWQAFSRSLLCINKYSYLKKRGHRNSEFYLLLQLINRVSNCLHIRCPILLLNYVFHPFVKCIVHLTMQKNPNLDWCIYSTILHHTFEPLVLLVSSIREPQTT